jgi:hypothetical protein
MRSPPSEARSVNAHTHRTLDFATVTVFLLAPIALRLAGAAAYLSYTLAVVHLGVTLATAFPGAAARPLPIAAHGAIELAVGAALAALPWIAGWHGAARWFYTAAGVAILVAWALTRYRVAPGTPSGAS